MAWPAVEADLNPAVHSNYYEAPASATDTDEIWCYCDRPCYSPGETIAFHVSTSATRYRLEIARDASRLEVVYQRDNLPGRRHPTPPDASVRGCGWPGAFELTIPADWRSGG